MNPTLSQRTRVAALSVAVAAAAGLAACGGGGDSAAPAPAPPVAPAPIDPLAQVPVSADQSAAGWIAYIRLLLAAPGADLVEPVNLNNVSGVPDDFSEPSPLT
jgi:hypothetical protein